MALRVFIPMPQGGSRKGGTFGAWFSELAKKELDQAAARQISWSKHRQLPTADRTLGNTP
jgi:hypothetical protein